MVNKFKIIKINEKQNFVFFDSDLFLKIIGKIIIVEIYAIK